MPHSYNVHPSTNCDQLLRARIVLPVNRLPIENGAVLISGNRITAVGRWEEFQFQNNAEIIDLGDSILMPGLVNAHCHLDYTDMAGLLPPQRMFTDWIKLMLATKAEWNYTEFAESWLNGARMLLRSGTTTVGDFEAVPELLPDVWESTPLRIISFLEMTGVKNRRDPQTVLNEALSRLETLRHDRCQAALAPHAPYSTVPELIRISSETARERQMPISIHVSESALEFEMFMRGRGEMFEWLKRNERGLNDCGQGSPIQQLERNGALNRNLLAVHVNYLADGDAELLARHNVSVVHCPRSHAYFQHAAFPYRILDDANVNLCLGTDSLATVYKARKDTVELSVFEEMRAFAGKHPETSPEMIVRMATVNGAQALGMAGQIGELTPGAFADVVAIPFSDSASDAYSAILHHRGEVAASLIDGRWAVGPNRLSVER